MARAALCYRIKIPEPGIFFVCEMWNRRKFACGIRDPGLWNPELHLKESGIQVLLTKSPKSSSWNPGSMARNPESKAVLNFPEQYTRNGDESRQHLVTMLGSAIFSHGQQIILN